MKSWTPFVAMRFIEGTSETIFLTAPKTRLSFARVIYLSVTMTQLLIQFKSSGDFGPLRGEL